MNCFETKQDIPYESKIVLLCGLPFVQYIELFLGYSVSSLLLFKVNMLNK